MNRVDKGKLFLVKMMRNNPEVTHQLVGIWEPLWDKIWRIKEKVL